MTTRILVAEDDTELRKLILQGLQKAGYEVAQAESGEQAIDLLRQEDAAFDAVVTDIVMGNIDGTEVMKVARALPSAPEVILLTGYGSLESAMVAIRAGAFDYLLKPCRMAQLLERVQAALELRAARLRQAYDAEAWQRTAAVVTHLQNQNGIPAAQSSLPPAADLPVTPPPQRPSSSPAEQRRYLVVGGLRVDTHRHEIWFGEQNLHVTPTEYSVLARLAATPERVVTFDELADEIHEENFDRTKARALLSWHIHNLRQKIDRRYLVSVRGTGYMLVDPDVHVSPPSES
jgi:DNA-binding response OmpR family regulator